MSDDECERLRRIVDQVDDFLIMLNIVAIDDDYRMALHHAVLFEARVGEYFHVNPIVTVSPVTVLVAPEWDGGDDEP